MLQKACLTGGSVELVLLITGAPLVKWDWGADQPRLIRIQRTAGRHKAILVRWLCAVASPIHLQRANEM
jgi:hypothetical protein